MMTRPDDAKAAVQILFLERVSEKLNQENGAKWVLVVQVDFIVQVSNNNRDFFLLHSKLKETLLNILHIFPPLMQ